MSTSAQNRKQAAPQKAANRAVVATVFDADLVENNTDWVLMTGASRHICINKALFAEYKEGGDGECVEMLDSSVAQVVGKGKVVLKLRDGKTLSLRDVLYVPTIIRNMVSAGLLLEAGLEFRFEGNGAVITRNGEFVGRANRKDLYVLDVDDEIIC